MTIRITALFKRPSYSALFRISLCLILTSTILSACSSNKEKEKPKSTEQELYEQAQGFLENSNWQFAIANLQELEENFPFGAYSEQAQLELIYAYFKSGEYEASISASERFLRLHPEHRNVDYAYYMRGVASFHNDSAFNSFVPVDVTRRDAGTAKEAFNYFSQLLNVFPESPYALDATKRMTFLRNSLARSEIHIANYYFKRGAYLAAVNRGRWVVENMQETPAIPDALAVMAQGYHLLGMQTLSDDATKILAKNFPDYPALKGKAFDYKFGRDEKPSMIKYLTFGLFGRAPDIEFDTRDLYNPYKRKDSQELSPPTL